MKNRKILINLLSSVFLPCFAPLSWSQTQADSEQTAEQSVEVKAETAKSARNVRAGTEVVSLSDTIVGNQEQPTVLYIVPWKPAEDTTILYLPLSSKATEEIFGHVERVEHQRQVQFVEQLDGAK